MVAESCNVLLVGVSGFSPTAATRSFVVAARDVLVLRTTQIRGEWSLVAIRTLEEDTVFTHES